MSHVDNISAEQFLRDSFAIFEDKSDWTKGAYARDEDGEVMAPYGGKKFGAVCHCMTGAMRSAWSEYRNGQVLELKEELSAYSAVLKAIEILQKEKLEDGYKFRMDPQWNRREMEEKIAEFNDHCNTGFCDVKIVINKAINIASNSTETEV